MLADPHRHSAAATTEPRWFERMNLPRGAVDSGLGNIGQSQVGRGEISPVTSKLDAYDPVLWWPSAQSGLVDSNFLDLFRRLAGFFVGRCRPSLRDVAVLVLPYMRVAGQCPELGP
jgi:hypothetical protein